MDSEKPPTIDPEWLAWRTRQRVPGSAVGRPAQELYRELVNRHLSPAFRETGLVGSGGRYSLRREGSFALMALQKSTYSDATEVRFTINLQVARTDEWAAARRERPYLPERPHPGTTYGAPATCVRIGELLPERADIWWWVRDDVDGQAVVADVVAAVREHGLPWLRANAS